MQCIKDLQEMAAFLQRFAEHSEQIYWLANPEMTRVIYLNPAAERIFGYSPKALYKDSRVWIDYLVPEDVQYPHPFEVMAEHVEKMGTKAQFNKSYRIKRRDKEIRWLIDRGAPVCDINGHIIGISGTAIDISEDKKILEHIASEIPSVSLIAHDIKKYINQISTKQRSSHKIFSPLTNRELQCLIYLMHGFRNKLIAQRLGISTRTIEFHIENIKKKFGCNNITRLIDLCWQAVRTT